jgi:galactokinase
MTGSPLLASAEDGFQRTFGYPATGLWSAPGRVNLIGEHTDYNEGFVLPFAIDRRTVVALALRDDGIVRVSSGSVSSGSVSAGTVSSGTAGEIVSVPLARVSPGAVHGWAAYPVGVAWGLGQVGSRAGLGGLAGFDAHFASDVPVGAGLSSSAAIESSLAVALNEAWELGVERGLLVQATHLAENDFVGAPTGILDQSAALLSRAGAALFLDCRDGSSSPVDLRLDDFGLAILVVDTKVKHEHVSGGYAARRASCEKAARSLGVPALRDVSLPELNAARGKLDDEDFRRARHIVTEDQRVLDTVEALRATGPEAIGGLLVASHASMRDDFEISTPELDLAVSVAMDEGALGARMTGGGFGGSAIALAPAGLLPRLRAAISDAFGDRGYPAPEMFTVRPSQGARRDS